ncbi:hypothetical protein S40288_01186 [Stachybotrys chartarum IBT 40288]|nr:hypothetical protein S40288_01186 [Stachybotrys chartarum IBT 40288]
MPARDNYSSISIPMSPPPPQDLSTYSRFIHDHTKQQMKAFGPNSPGKSSHSSSMSSTGMSNGASVSAYI